MTNPTQKPKRPKKLPKYLKEDKLRTLLNTPHKTNRHHILIMKLMAKCGLRESEVVGAHYKKSDRTIPGLKVMDIDFSNRSLTVREGKGRKDRVVPFDENIGLALESWIKDNHPGETDKLFNMGVRNVRRFVKDYGKKAGFEEPLNAHMLRHSFAVMALKNGMNIRTVQKILGHSSMTTTAIYLDITAEDVIKDYQEHPLPV